MPCVLSVRDITILYPVGTATIVTIDIDADLSFVTKRDTNEQAIRVQDWINIQIILKYTTIMRITV